MDVSPPSNRRRFLRRCGTALAIGLAGCLGTERAGTAGTPDPVRSPSLDTDTATPSVSSTPDAGESPSDGQSPVVWREELGAPVTTPPTVSGDTVYVATESGAVHAMATDDGRERWTFDTGQPIQRRPVLADGAVFVVSGTMELGANHEVYALDAATGRKRWRFGPQSWWLELFGAFDVTLYVGTSDDAISNTGQTLYALTTDAGTERWSAEIGDPSGGLVADETVYIPSYGRLYAYDALDGKRRWTKDLADYSHRTIAANDDTVFYVTETDGARGAVFALETATGEKKWSFDDWFATSTTFHGGTLYVGGAHVAAFDPATGEQRWQADDHAFVPRVPVRDGTLYAGGDGMRAYNVDDGTVRWSWSPDPAVRGALPAAATSEVVYVDSYREQDPRNRYKFAVEVETGEQRWVFDGETELSDLVSDGQRVFVGGENGIVYALGPR